jgi:hypothetical protein
MNAGEALEILESLQPDLPGVRASTGTKERGLEPYLLLENAFDPNRWAVVYTNIAWTSVQTNSNYSRLHIDEDIPRDEMMALLQDFVRTGVAYVLGSGEIMRTGFFKTPKLVVRAGDKEEMLSLSLLGELAWIFKPWGRSTATSRR